MLTYSMYIAPFKCSVCLHRARPAAVPRPVAGSACFRQEEHMSFVTTTPEMLASIWRAIGGWSGSSKC